MSIENLKKMLESDIEEIKSYHGCLTGDCPHNNSTDCCLELMNQAHEAATNRLLPLLQKMMKVIELYSHEDNYDFNFYGPDEDDFAILENKYDCTQSEVGETAREFIAEFTKLTELTRKINYE